MGLAVSAFAGPLSGKWCTTLYFDWVADNTVGAQVVTLPGFSSTLELDYTVCGWTFSSTAVFTKHAFANLYFEAQGSVGAFGFYGILDFIPQTASFHFLIGFVDVSIAGVNLYGGGGIRNFNAESSTAGSTTPPLTGVGWVVGGYGVAGDCAIWAEAQWNFDALIGDIYADGYNAMIDYILYTSSADCQEKKPNYNVQSPGCCACWTALDVYVEYSFACFDVLTKVNFDCTSGFDAICFEIDDICTGLDWLLLDDLNICFNVQTKSVCGQFELVLSDCVCFTPYLSLVMDPNNNARVTGIEINALTLEYDMGQGVTFKAGTFFDTTWGDTGFAKVGDTATCDNERNYCWDSNGNIVRDYDGDDDCCINPDYDEYFAVLIDGDACCGGAFSVEIYNWFDDDLPIAPPPPPPVIPDPQGGIHPMANGATTTFMDWAETEIDITIGVGSNTTLSFGFDLGQAGLRNWSVGWCFEW